MGPAELHLANSEFHREIGAILALRLHLPANADDALLAGAQVSGQVTVMFLLMRRGHEHLDVAPDHLTGSVAEQLFCGFAEILDNAALVDRDDRVGGGLKNGAEPCLSLLKHRLRAFCLRHIRVELQDRYRIATIASIQCPSACYYHSTAIEMSAHEFTLPYSCIQQLSLNRRQRHRKLSREEFMEMLPTAFSAGQP